MARGWSQEEFAAKCNLHRTYVGAIERAEENLTLRTLDKLAKALHVMPAVLVMPQTPIEDNAKGFSPTRKQKKPPRKRPRMSAIARRQNSR